MTSRMPTTGLKNRSDGQSLDGWRLFARPLIPFLPFTYPMRNGR